MAPKKTTKKARKQTSKAKVTKTPQNLPSEVRSSSPNEPTIAVASASMVGRGSGTDAEVNRALRLEKAMNDAFNKGLAQGVTDPQKLVELKIKARQDFLVKNG
jgi:N-methylhydantoinase A/oxoprolinase/acetone carboxylase beta subunit